MGATSVCDCACSPFSEENESKNNTEPQSLKKNQFAFESMDEFEQFVQNAMITDNMSDALHSCEKQGIPIMVRIESGKNFPKAEVDSFNTLYFEVDINGHKRFTTQKHPTSKVKWNENLLFLLPFKLIDKILHYSTANGVIHEHEEKPSVLNITFRLYQRDALHQVSYMTENTYMMEDIDITHDQISYYNPKSEMEIKSKIEYAQSSDQIQLQGVDVVVESPVIGLGLFDGKMEEIKPQKTESALSKYSSNTALNVHPTKKNVCIAQYQIEIDLLQDLSLYHEELRCGKLQYMKENTVYQTLEAGQIMYKVFLNGATVYRELKDNQLWPYGLEML